MRIRLRETLARTYHRIVGYQQISINGIRYKCDPYHQKFWNIVNGGRWEPETFTILDKYLSKDSVYCDIGAWIGPTVIFAARKCKQAYCFEPDTIAYRFLLWNIALNNLKNVLPNNIALSDKEGIETISSLGTELGDSMTSLLGDDSSESINILCMRWDNWRTFVKPGRIDFLKIDIEGAEFDFMPSIKDYLEQEMPIVYLSLHAPFFDEKLREEKLQIIIDTMSIYDHCYNENLEEIDISSLTSGENQVNFCSFVFTK